jgi:hypothetical protein
MRYLVAALGFYVISALGLAEGAAPQTSDVDAAIGRGLTFLAKDALAWRDEHKCVSCHHASLVVWSMREAKASGYAVDEPFLTDLTKWVAETSGDGKTGIPRPEGIPRALNEKAVSLALALGSEGERDAAAQERLNILLQTVKSDQTDNGSWASWPETRQPIFGNSDERTTLAAILALLPAAASGDDTANAARDKGIQWLANAKTDDDPQSIALRLVLWRRLARPAEECTPLVQRIRERQNADGGWSQTTDMASDAWATGQALYALPHGGIQSDDPSVERGRGFLIKTQRDDGSWPMTSRPIKPGDEGAKSLIPITAAGSAWAVMGLVRSR